MHIGFIGLGKVGGKLANCLVRNNLQLVVLDLERAAARDGIERYGTREWSPNIIRRQEERVGQDVLADGFLAQMTADEPEEAGHELVPGNRLSLKIPR